MLLLSSGSCAGGALFSAVTSASVQRAASHASSFESFLFLRTACTALDYSVAQILVD
jgi:hypothetical protein